MRTKETLTFRLDKETREALRKIAERERRSMAWMVEEYVRQGIGRDQNSDAGSQERR